MFSTERRESVASAAPSCAISVPSFVRSAAPNACAMPAPPSFVALPPRAQRTLQQVSPMGPSPSAAPVHRLLHLPGLVRFLPHHRPRVRYRSLLQDRPLVPPVQSPDPLRLR